MDSGVAVVIGALIGAVSGLTIAIMQLRANKKQQNWAYEERKNAAEELKEQQKQFAKERQQYHLFGALEFFTGKTQRRNVGIAIVEGLWEEFPNLTGILIPLLGNQAIYLLTQSEQGEDLHERDNLDRIMSLLSKYEEKNKYPHNYNKVIEAIEKCQRGELKKGIQVDPETLERWKDHLEYHN